MTHDDLQRLLAGDDLELRRQAAQAREEFVFGVRDDREAFENGEWGGEFRILINHNIVLHLVPGFNRDMSRREEMPQFAIVFEPEDERDSDDEVVLFEGVRDLDPYSGVHFHVGREEYDSLRDELAEISGQYRDFTFIPDVLYADTCLVRLIMNRVLVHRLVLDERRYDFTKLHF